MAQIGRLDFCRGKSNVQPVVADPTDAAAVDLASMGCTPLLAHDRSADTSVLSSLKKNGQSVSTLILTSTETAIGPTEVDHSGTDASTYDPTDAFGSYAAGLSAVQPITGAGTSPFPAPSEPVVDLNVSFGVRRIVRSLAGVPLCGDPLTAGDISAVLGAGFGGFGTNTNDFNFEGDVVLNEVTRKSSKRWRAFHTYNPKLRLGYTPTLSPLLVDYHPLAMNYTVSFANTFSAGFVGSASPGPGVECQGQVTLVLVSPVLTTCAGTPFAGDPAQPINVGGPSLDREYCEIEVGPFTAGAYAEGTTENLTIADNLRGNLIIYGDQTVTAITGVPGGAGSSTPIGPIQIAASNPVPIFDNQIFDKAFVFAVNGTDTTFTFTMSGPCGSLTTNTVDIYATSGFTQIPGVFYWWEGYAHIETVPI